MDKLTSLNTMGLASSCEKLFKVSNGLEIEEAIQYADSQSLSLVVLGGGSNIILAEHISSVFIQPVNKEVEVVEKGDEILVRVGAGYNWHDLVMWTSAQGFYGLENLALIPGNIGASPVQNIGAYGVELADRFVELVAFDLRTKQEITLDKSVCRFGYRDSLFKQEEGRGRYVILSVTLALTKHFQPDISYRPLKLAFENKASFTSSELIEEVIRIRSSKLPDPAKLGNAGSFFKNPVVSKDKFDALKGKFPELVGYSVSEGEVKLAAGWLIDQAGLKGFTLGPVGMHKDQALVMVNHGGATRADVEKLMRHVQEQVHDVYSVSLEHEPIFIG